MTKIKHGRQTYESHHMETDDWELVQAVLADGEKLFGYFSAVPGAIPGSIFMHKHIGQEHKLRLSIPLKKVTKTRHNILWMQFVVDYFEDEQIAWLEWFLPSEQNRFRVVANEAEQMVNGAVEQFNTIVEWYNSKVAENYANSGHGPISDCLEA